MSGQIYERKYVDLYIKIIGEGKLVLPDVEYTREQNTAKRSDKDKHGAPGGRKNDPVHKETVGTETTGKQAVSSPRRDAESE